MIAKITTGSGVHGALLYNQEKVDEGKGEILGTHIIREPENGIFNVSQTAKDLLAWMPLHYRTKKPVIHISLNPNPQDNLTNSQLTEIAKEYMNGMGWGEQPYIVFKHTDTAREHIHIVSVQVDSNGRKIKDSKRNIRSVRVTEEIEQKYGLLPAKGQKEKQEYFRLTPVDFGKGNLKKQIGTVVKSLSKTYLFQTLGEFRALLSIYNIGIEETDGQRNGKPYRGLLYTVLQENGEKAVVPPIKSSLFGKEVGYDALQKRINFSCKRIKGTQIDKTINERISEFYHTAESENDLREKLKASNIILYIRRNDTGRITGVTFIDHQSRCVMNGSRLGKEFSANSFSERFINNTPHSEQKHINNNLADKKRRTWRKL